MQEAPYKIYNASAGSGKTYTLAKEYLKIVLATDFNKSYRNILAITFTNKAVNEMKQRILGSLFQFGSSTSDQAIPPMLQDISNELNTPIPILQQRSRYALKEILHNYAFFDVSTIDKFTHRLIRTFAKDLKLPQNFEVVLDTDLLLNEAVVQLINKTGSDKKLTQVLVDFAMEKIDEDKSWDIGIDLNKIGKLLFDEQEIPHLKKLEGKEIDDFLVLKNSLQQNIRVLGTKIKENADHILRIITENGLEFGDFKASYFPKFILKIAEGDLNIDFDAAWKQNFETAPLYTTTCPAGKKDTLDGLHPTFNSYFQQIREHHITISLLKNAYGNIVPLTVLHAIQRELNTLEREKDLLPISAFNSLISEEIKDQPAPFIYERIGEKYRHFFIDEFQDTSQMQWDNLIPLVGNALESGDSLGNTGSLLLVGDAKQAIYRWRGGKAEQFLDLIHKKQQPFVSAPHNTDLPANYRSHEEVIRFNNDFFTTISSFLGDTTYEELFVKGNQQQYNSKKGGLAQITFVEGENAKEDEKKYCEAVLATLEEVVQKKYALSDICILTRKRKQGILLADFLMQHEIPIISSETLLLQHNPKVAFLIHLLNLSIQPTDPAIGFEVLSFLFREGGNLHRYIADHLPTVPKFLRQHYGFDLERLNQSTVYDGLEYAIKKFKLAETSDAYITYLLDVVLDVGQLEGTNAQVFLTYWEKKKSKLSVTAPENIDAVQIMTVHKAKGLEFPIVIFPFANSNIYEEIEPKLWLPVAPEAFQGFSEILINKKQEVLQYGETASAIYHEEEHKLELDAFNLLYVALTRAIKGLYIITKMDLLQTGAPREGYYSGLFIQYLKDKGLWDPGQTQYAFGSLEDRTETGEQQEGSPTIPYTYTFKNRPEFRILTKSGVLWDTDRENALSKGNMVHYILGLIYTQEDIDPVLNEMIKKGDLAQDDYMAIRDMISSLVTHPGLAPYFSTAHPVRNEQEILTRDGRLLRPDKIILKDEKASIIDYKTGQESPHHVQQVHLYAEALKEMGYEIENKILVYINNENITLNFI